jgi:hypothetical protein
MIGKKVSLQQSTFNSSLRVTMEQVGYLETPHVGEWGYDYEIDGIYEDDILVTRACGPPHEIRFWGLENICTMEIGDIQPLKEHASNLLSQFFEKNMVL